MPWHPAPRLTSTERFVEINGLTPICTIQGFSPWRFSFAVHGVLFLESPFKKMNISIFLGIALSLSSHQGIYPDLLHICDLALYCDVYAGAYIAFTDDASVFEGRNRDERLSCLHKLYLKWCTDNRTSHDFEQILYNVST